MQTDKNGVVLIVDDDRNLADLYSSWLSELYTVKTAYSGEAALTKLNPSVDVVLLDRRMPDLDGEHVLATIRERDLHCQVALVTSSALDYDSLPLGFDDYIRKPVSKPALRTLIESLLIRTEYSKRLQDYFALVSKRVALQTEKDDEELAAHPEVRKLDAQIAELKQEIDGLLSEFSDAEYRAIFSTLGTNGNTRELHGLG